MISALVIVCVVGGVMITITPYTEEIVEARDQVREVNETLEARVTERT